MDRINDFARWWDEIYNPLDAHGRRKRTWMSSCGTVMEEAARAAWIARAVPSVEQKGARSDDGSGSSQTIVEPSDRNALNLQIALGEAYDALDAIDRIVSDDFCEDLDMRAAFDEQPLSPDLKTAHSKLSAVYQIAHSESPRHSCYRVHADWRQLKKLHLSENAPKSDSDSGFPKSDSPSSPLPEGK